MARSADPSFEVATIKPSDPGDRNQGFQLHGHRVVIENEPVTSLICFAYSIQKSQIVNAPAWLDDARWSIDGVPDVEGYPNQHQYQRMVEKLLNDRFGLHMHQDKRELPAYTLTVTKGDAKLALSKSDPDAPIDQTGRSNHGEQSWKFTNNSMADFAMGLQSLVSRPVLDETSLSGRFDFTLRWTPDDLRTTDANAPPGIFTAIQEQLGLKLQPVKAPVDVLVIDRVEKPSEN